MPNKWTFSIKPIEELLIEEVESEESWCDPFCGEYTPATVRNDLNPKIPAEYHMDAHDFLKSQKTNSFDGVLLDPPYSLRQISEHYKAAGIKCTGWHTSAGWGSTLKDEAARIIKHGGKAICFGWSSMGLGKSRGFRMDRILLVPHGGSKNDTIVTVEIKL